MLVEIVIGLLSLVGILYVYITWKFDYWTKMGVYQIKPSFPLGTVSALFTRSKALNDMFLDRAEETQGRPYYGEYLARCPILVIKDVELIRHILVKDFDCLFLFVCEASDGQT
jgi:hypothetical protein